jgi:hypothetical protein
MRITLNIAAKFVLILADEVKVRFMFEHSATYYEIRNNDLLKHICVCHGLTWLHLKKALTMEIAGVKENI